MQWMADHEPEAIRADYVLTENGGLHSGPKEQPYISINVGEKGVAWRRLRVRGTPGHGSTPFKADNALMTAAAVMQRIGMLHDATWDFDHPRVPDTEPHLRPHVFYRLMREDWHER